MDHPIAAISLALSFSATNGALVAGGAYFRRNRRVDSMRGVRAFLGFAAALSHASCVGVRVFQAPQDGGYVRVAGEIWLSTFLAALIPAAFALRDRAVGPLAFASVLAYVPAISMQIATGGRWFALEIASWLLIASLISSMRELQTKRAAIADAPLAVVQCGYPGVPGGDGIPI